MMTGPSAFEAVNEIGHDLKTSNSEAPHTNGVLECDPDTKHSRDDYTFIPFSAIERYQMLERRERH